MTLPVQFLQNMQQCIPAEEYQKFVESLSDSEPVTSIRVNTSKLSLASAKEHFPASTAVGWCEEGLYLDQRPQFTLDPLLHSGAYYVQEASSMFITHVLRHYISTPVTCLDLCAAPGGKSTAAMSALPEGSQFISNEIDRRRARILAENITKWGNPYVTVTCNAPKDFRNFKHTFDVIITDVPCSGEGMMRKDETAVSDWSPAKVSECESLQRQILDQIWDCLKPGGLLVYSTCTFNTAEDEQQISYICNTLGATALEVPTLPEWNIHKPLLGTDACYRFMPHFTKGEGLFMAVLRKDEGPVQPARLRKPLKSNIKVARDISNWVSIPVILEQNAEGTISAIPQLHKELHDLALSNGLYIIQSGIELGTVKGKDIIPSQNLALSNVLSDNAFPKVEVDSETALDYLRRMAVTLQPGSPSGYIILSYQNLPLGYVKNLGNRSNNLYPQEWRIRNL